jgi:hypothetical protein
VLISRDSRPAPWDGIRTARASAVVQAVTRTARFPQDPAAAAPLTAVPFAAAPLAEGPMAETTLAKAPTAEAPTAETMAEATLAKATTAEAPMTETMAETPSVTAPEPSQPVPENRLPIFESVESDWFSARRRPSRRATTRMSPRRQARAWTSPGDHGWRTAEAVLEPEVAGVTTAGLPRRAPQANLVPGSAGDRQAGPARPADTAEAMSSRLAGFQRGSRRARAAAPDAQPPAEQP